MKILFKIVKIVKKERALSLTNRLKLSKAPFFDYLVTSFDNAYSSAVKPSP
jgi:hypothetical protein